MGEIKLFPILHIAFIILSVSSKTFFKAPRYLLRKHNILSLVDSYHINTFIDVGCGAGELACTLAEKNLTGVGVDYSDDALETAENLKQARNLNEDQIGFVKDLDSVTKKYEVAIACEVLEHVEDDSGLLEKLCNLSSKYVLVSVPAKKKYFDEFDVKVGHYRRYEKDELIRLIEEGGLEIEEFRSYGFPFINLTRLLRKIGAGRVKEQEDIQESTKQSGINPIKLPDIIHKLDMEKAIKPFYYFSLPFNRFDVSEGYLVLARKKE